MEAPSIDDLLKNGNHLSYGGESKHQSSVSNNNQNLHNKNNIMSEFIRPPLSKNFLYNRKNTQNEQIVAPLPLKVDDFSGDTILEWIVGVGTYHSKIDHKNYRKALKEATKSNNGAEFNYIPKLDAHPETFLLQRFDKDIHDIEEEMNGWDESSKILGSIGSSSNHQHANLKHLTKRDISLHKRNMEIRALSRASILSLIENEPETPSSKNYRKNSMNTKRNSIGGTRKSGVDFFAAAANAAAAVGLHDIASNLDTSSVDFQTSGAAKFESSVTEDLAILNDATDHQYPITELTPDKFSSTIQHSNNQSSQLYLQSAQSQSPTIHILPSSTAANSSIQQQSLAMSHTDEYHHRIRSYSTNALEGVRTANNDSNLFESRLIKSNSPVNIENRPRTSGDMILTPKASARKELSRSPTPQEMIGIRSKLKFEGASILESPYFYHMTKEAHSLILEAPPPGVPVKNLSASSKRKDTTKQTTSTNRIGSPSQNGSSSTLALTMPKIITNKNMSIINTRNTVATIMDRDRNSAFVPIAEQHQRSKSMIMKLPPGIQKQHQALFPSAASDHNYTESSNKNSTSPPPPFLQPNSRIPSKYSLEVQEINASINSVLVPPIRGLNNENSADLLYKLPSSNMSYQSIRSHSSSSFHSEHRSSRISPPGLLHIQPQRKKTAANLSFPSQIESSATHLTPNRKSLDFLVSSVQVGGALATTTASPSFQPDFKQFANHQQAINTSVIFSKESEEEAIGIEITDLHSDPLYRILQEEIESFYSDSNDAVKVKVTSLSINNINDMIINNDTRNIPSILENQPQTLQQRSTKKKNTKKQQVAKSGEAGISDYKTRVLSSFIKPSDLRILSSFISLPSAVWFTCRITYFLIISYYELMIRSTYDPESSNKSIVNSNNQSQYQILQLNMDQQQQQQLWFLLEQQMRDTSISMETIDTAYSWPLLQAIIGKYPLQFVKLLSCIEQNTNSGRLLVSQLTQTSTHSTISTFYDAFPPSKLKYLRNIVKQGMLLFQSHDLMQTVTVSAQLCDWCKRVMTGIYASCLKRLRAKQSIANTVRPSALHSTSYYHTSNQSVVSVDNDNPTDDFSLKKSNADPILQSIYSSSLYGPTVYGTSTVKIQVPNTNQDITVTNNSSSSINIQAQSMVPYFTFILAVEDVFNSQSFFQIKNQIIPPAASPWMNSNDNNINNDNSNNLNSNDLLLQQSLLRNSIPPSDTFVRGLGLVKPTDRLDLLLIPPNIDDIDNQLSIVKFTSPLGSNMHESNQVESSVKQLLDIWLAIRNVYVDHVQYYSSSPMHQVCILPIDKTEILRQQQSNYNNQFTDNNLILQVNELITAKLLFPYTLQDKGIHPVIEHALCFEYSTNHSSSSLIVHSSDKATSLQHNDSSYNKSNIYPTFSPVHAVVDGYNSSRDNITQSNSSPVTHNKSVKKCKIQADILVTHLRNGNIPQFFSNQIDIRQLDFKFSLVLIDDFSPATPVHRPLSPYSSFLNHHHHYQRNNTNIAIPSTDIEPVVASTTGPNRYMVCVTDKLTSWIAFQMACRLAKPSDTIVLVHIPVISQYSPKSSSKHNKESPLLTMSSYLQQRKICEKRIEDLISLYKDTGFNLYIDQIPTYEDALYRHAIYSQRDSYYEGAYAASKHQIHGGNTSPEYFLLNQQAYNISSRLVTIVNEFEPDFVIVGGKCVTVQDMLTSTVSPSQNYYNSYNNKSFHHKNFNFPYTHAVSDNTIDIDRLQAESNNNPIIEVVAAVGSVTKQEPQVHSSRSYGSYSSSGGEGGIDAEKGLYLVDSSSGAGYNSRTSNMIMEEGSKDMFDFDDTMTPRLMPMSYEDDYNSGEFYEENSSNIIPHIHQSNNNSRKEESIRKLILNPETLSLQSIVLAKPTMKQKEGELVEYINYATNKISISEMMLQQYLSVHYHQHSNNNNQINNNMMVNNLIQSDESVKVFLEMKRFSLVVSNSNAF